MKTFLFIKTTHKPWRSQTLGFKSWARSLWSKRRKFLSYVNYNSSTQKQPTETWKILVTAFHFNRTTKKKLRSIAFLEILSLEWGMYTKRENTNLLTDNITKHLSYVPRKLSTDPNSFSAATCEGEAHLCPNQTHY